MKLFLSYSTSIFAHQIFKKKKKILMGTTLYSWMRLTLINWTVGANRFGVCDFSYFQPRSQILKATEKS